MSTKWPTPKSAMSTHRETAPTVRDAIRQTRPFRTPSQEAVIALGLTSEIVRGAIGELLVRHGAITPQQFNVLRILRGAGDGGLPTLDVAERMIERTPGITRLIDRLADKGLVTRERSADDRRRVVCTITAAGLRLLDELDEPIDALDERLFAALSRDELETLIDLLNRIRLRAGTIDAPRTAPSHTQRTR